MAHQILVTGGNGRLAKALRPLLPEGTLFASHSMLDVRCPSQCERIIRIWSPSVIIHCAALMAAKCESDKLLAWAVNVEGTRNIALAAARECARLVFISSDYVFGGLAPKGGYPERGLGRQPINFYGRTKVAGENIALRSPNNLVVRAPFRYRPWPYDNAFSDQYTSARWIDEAAVDLTCAAQSNLTGIVHMGGPRRSVHEMASEISPGIRPSRRCSWPGLQIPYDTSLDSTEWERWKAKQ